MPARFCVAVRKVRHNDAPGIGKSGNGFPKADAVFGQIGGFFVFIPFKMFAENHSSLSWIQWAVQGQVEFASHAGVGRVGEGKFAVGGVLELAAARNGAGFIKVHSISPASA